ncbi:MAG: hypothetical protein ACLTG4_01665 [Oscillospiraceae bacterium]
MDAECARLRKRTLPVGRPRRDAHARGTAPASSGVSLADLLRRPQITYADLARSTPRGRSCRTS